MAKEMLENIIKYYEKVTDMALVNLSQGKQFQLRKMLTNHSLMQVTEDNLLKLHDSANARKLISEYKTAMNNMAKVAQKDYKNTLNKLKATNDEALRQKILNDYAERGIHGFTAKNGAKWNIETYSNMYTANIWNEIVRLSVIEQSTNKLFLVSSHNCHCELCEWWEGKVLNLDELQAARNDGLFHTNCVHYLTEVDE